MTRVLEEAINRLRELPEEEQDAAAFAVFAYLTADDRNEPTNVDDTETAPRSRFNGSHISI
jgi:hypothetical protein